MYVLRNLSHMEDSGGRVTCLPNTDVSLNPDVSTNLIRQKPTIHVVLYMCAWSIHPTPASLVPLRMKRMSRARHHHPLPRHGHGGGKCLSSSSSTDIRHRRGDLCHPSQSVPAAPVSPVSLPPPALWNLVTLRYPQPAAVETEPTHRAKKIRSPAGPANDS